MTARTRRRHADGDESRERILDATIEIASLRGYHGTSIAQVSERSGLPASSIYWHFASKDDLIAAVIERSFNTWLAAMTRIGVRASSAEPRTAFASSLRGQAAALLKSPEFIRLGLMLALEEHPTEPTARALFVQIRERTKDAMLGGFEQLIADCHGAPDRQLATRLVRFVMASADGLFIAHVIDPTVELGDAFDLVADAVLGIVDRHASETRREPARRSRPKG